jgi:anti-sigma factor RsiW
MTMSCGQARRLLWPDGGPREASADIVAAREHASDCEACTEFFRDMQRMSEQFGRHAPRPAAPPEVRERLFKAIAQARSARPAPPRDARLRQMTVAGVAALLIVALSWLSYLAVQDRSAPGDAIGAIVEDRLRSQQGVGLTSSDSLQVAQWLAERLPFAVQVPIFPDARLVGARLLVDNRRSGAVVEYTVQGLVLTYYILPESGAGFPRQINLGSRNGYRVASWHDAGLTHALVATLPGSKLIEYARYCMHQMMA